MISMLTLLLSLGLAADPEVASQFVRFVPEGEDGGRLETAIASYENDNGVEVILYGAVHVGEPSYYNVLNREFESRDSLLYELVAPKGTRPNPNRVRRGGFNLISMFQRGLKRTLNLEFQLDGVDYQPSNFVHADMSPSQFSRAQRAKGESFLTLMFDVWIQSLQLAASGKGSGVTPDALLAAFSSADASRKLKLLFAQEMDTIESMFAGIEKDGGSVILTERNKVCLGVLEDEINKGRKKLGMFYGAAHLVDMEQRLQALGFERKSHRWLTAWDCSAPIPKTQSKRARF